MGYGIGPGMGQPGKKPVQKNPKGKPQPTKPTAPKKKTPAPLFSLADFFEFITGKRR